MPHTDDPNRDPETALAERIRRVREADTDDLTPLEDV